MNDWIKEWYKNQFNKIDLTPSSKVWDNISETLNDWPKHWYQSNVEKLDVKPDPMVWENLSAEINSSNRGTSVSWRPSVAASFLFILFSSLLPFYLKHEESTLLAGNENPNIVYKAAKVEQARVSNSYTPKETTKNEKDSSTDQVSRKSKSVSREKIGTRPFELNTSKIKETDFDYSLVEPLDKNLLDHTEKNNFLSQEHTLSPKVIPFKTEQLTSLTLVKPIEEKNTKNSWKIGGFISPQTSLLNNPLTDLIATDQTNDSYGSLSVGVDIILEKQFTQKNGVRATIRSNNVKSLNLRSQDILGADFQRNFVLNYVTLDLNYVHSFSLNTDNTLKLKALFGGFTGYLVNKSVTYNGEQVRYIEDGYKNWDFGTSLGLFINQSISDNFSLEAGFHSQIGMFNTFSGTTYLPANFFRTTTISNAFSIGVLYSF